MGVRTDGLTAKSDSSSCSGHGGGAGQLIYSLAAETQLGMWRMCLLCVATDSHSLVQPTLMSLVSSLLSLGVDTLHTDFSDTCSGRAQHSQSGADMQPATWASTDTAQSVGCLHGACNSIGLLMC